MDNNTERENNITIEYEKFVKLFTDDLESSDLGRKIDEVNALIEHVNNRIHYTETRITRTVTFAVSLVAIGAALFSAVIRMNGWSFYLGMATSFLFIITGGITSLIHVFQVNPNYPFRALPNDWKWFYPRIIDKDYKPTAFVSENDEQFYKKRKMHIAGLINYASKLLGENDVERLKVDIQQLYLLHVNEKYKNCFLSTLRLCLICGLIITTLVLIGFLAILIIDKIGNVHYFDGV
jgi:hypothetical protein